MARSKKLPLTEELDFEYLLELMPPLHNKADFAWLPELFSIIGYERLILLCKYAGGEVIRIPTIEQLSSSVEALQWFYDVCIAKRRTIVEVPVKLMKLFDIIQRCYKDQLEDSICPGEEMGEDDATNG